MNIINVTSLPADQGEPARMGPGEKMEDLELVTAVTSSLSLAPARPSLVERTLSSPPLTPDTKTPSLKMAANPDAPSQRSVFPLTPPTSPVRVKSSASLATIMTPTATPTSTLHHPAPQLLTDLVQASVNQVHDLSVQDESPLIECPFDVEVAKDSSGRDQIFGQGAWSTVYRAIGREGSSSGDRLLTPPSSPACSIPLLVAVKKPARQDAKAILRSEALILSHLTRCHQSKGYVVPFYGFTSSTDSLVLGAVPLSLSDHIQTSAKRAYANTSTRSMWDPVVGSTKAWLTLAHRSITALAWLHGEARVVHGDIKPGNILLTTNYDADPAFPYDPLLTDFTSSQLMSSQTITPNTLSAITLQYTAPELLTSSVLNNPQSVATSSSDVFSLAVTLLVAATGDMSVYPGSMFQRRAMAMQGWGVFDFVRNGDHGSRVPRHGVVEQVLEKAVLRAGMGRIDAKTWLSLVDEKMLGDEPKKR